MRSRSAIFSFAVAVAVAVPSCGSSANSPPSSAPPLDASVEGGTLDAGTGGPDAPDALPPLPTPGLAGACNDSTDAAYAIPPGLPPLTPGMRGDVVRCARDVAIDLAAMNRRILTAGATGFAVASGAVTYRIAYRTTRADGSAGASTARVFLPTVPRSASLPLIVAAHGTAGLADICAPSKYETVSDYLVLPWVAHGYPVILPDYAGLGTGGTQGYGDNRDQAFSTLDAARALRKLLAPGALGTKVIVVGHSQGGGAALSAQALAGSYGADGDLVGVVGFAPGWAFDLNVDGFRVDGAPTTFGGGVPAVVAALSTYAYFANHTDPSHVGDAFAPASRAAVVQAIEGQCIFQLAQSIPAAAPTVAQLFDDAFRKSAINCVDGTTCAGAAAGYVGFLRGTFLTADKLGAKVLLVVGARDAVVPPSRIACLLQKLVSEGVTPQICTDDFADHATVTSRDSAYALNWADAILAGTSPPDCHSAQLTGCQ